jgi:hypothetical protein
MSRLNPWSWLFAGIVALTTHSILLVAFAALMQQRVTPPQTTVHFETDQILAPAIAEKVSDPVAGQNVAENSSAIAPTDNHLVLHEASAPAGAISADESTLLVATPASDAIAESKAAPDAATDTVSPEASMVLDAPSIEPLADTENLGEARTQLQTTTATASPDIVQEPATTSASEVSGISQAARVQAQDVESVPSVDATPAGQTVETALSASDAPVVAAETTASDGSPQQKPVVEQPASQEIQETTPSPPSSQVAIVQTAEPPPKPVQPQQPADLAGTVRDYHGGPCFLAVPLKDQAGQWHVTSYAPSQDDFSEFEKFLQRENAVDIADDSSAIAQAQCGAIGFVQDFAGSSIENFVIAIARGSLSDGDNVEAKVTGFQKPWIYLVLVDDDGLAQNISGYASVVEGAIAVSAPVFASRQGHARNQLLLAISSSDPLPTLDFKTPTPLPELLPVVRGQIAATAASVNVAVSHFQVK